MSTDFDKLAQKVKESMEGNYEPGIPMGFPRLGYHISLTQRMIYLLGGLSGGGKTSFLDDSFVLNPYDWYIKNKAFTKVELKIIYYSMERSKEFKIAKWALRKMFIEEGIIIPLQRLYRRPGYLPLNKQEYERFLHYKAYIDGMLESGIVDIYEGPRNPMGIKKFIDSYALSNGRIEKIGEHKSIYIPNNKNQITIIIKDHIGGSKTGRYKIQENR